MLNKFIVIVAKNIRFTENYLIENEPNFYNINYTKDFTTIRYKIPDELWYICSILEQTGYKGLSTDGLYDCIKFWGYNSDKVLINEKTQAARESSLGYFFYFSFLSTRII